MSENGRLPSSDLAPIARGRLRKDAAAAFNAMNVESRQRFGVELYPTGSKSSYRSYEQQVELRHLYETGRGSLAAIPGTSNHGWGVAVDFATPQMRTIVDRIGPRYGWSKAWSDAPSEWWHIKYQSGHYAGLDPGPDGSGSLPTVPDLPEETVAIAVATMKDGRFEVFVETSKGEVFHTWQNKDKPGWNGEAQGKTAQWLSLGKPGG